MMDGDQNPKFELASQEQVGYLSEYVDQILAALVEVDPELAEIDITESLITDESTLTDFFNFFSSPDEKKVLCQRLSSILNVEVNVKDYIVDIAARLAHY